MKTITKTANDFALPRVLIYTRVSTQEQARDGESLAVQLSLCIQACIERFGENLFTYELISDEGKSGSWGPIPYDPRPLKRKRKGLERAIAGLQAGEFDHLCAYKIDRLYRNMVGWLRLQELCAERRVGMFFAAESYDASITGQLASGVVATVAEYFRCQTVDNVKRTLDERRREGLWLGTPPFGWRYESAEERGTNRPSIVRVPTQVDLLLRIDKMYTSGLSFEEIARVLNAENAPQRRAVGRWEAVTVNNALMNHGHAGLIKTKDGDLVRGRHFESRLWDPSHYEELRATLRRRRRRFKGVAATQPFRLFSGLATCGSCGKRLRSEFSTSHPSYRCRGQGKGASHVHVSAGFLLAAVKGEIRKFANRPEVVQAARREIIAAVTGEREAMEGERESVQKKLSHLKQRKSRLLDALVNGLISQADYQDKVSEFSDDHRSLSTRLEELTTKLKASHSGTSFQEAALSKLSQFDAVWDSLENCEQREFIHAAVEKLQVFCQSDRLFMRIGLVGLPMAEVPIQRGKSRCRPARTQGPQFLTVREMAFLKHVLDGLKMTAIAEVMDIKLRHAYRLASRAMLRVGADSCREAAEAAREVIMLHLSILPLYGKKNRAFKPNPRLSVMEFQVLEARASGMCCEEFAALKDVCSDTVEELEQRAHAKIGISDSKAALESATARGQLPLNIRKNSCRIDRPAG